MRTKNPENLNIALNVLTNNFQVYMTQNNHPKNIFSNLNTQNYSHKNKTNFQNNVAHRQPPPKPNSMQNYQHTNRNPASNPQNRPSTSYNPSNRNNTGFYNNSQNVFKPNQNQRFPNPTPMSMSTRNTARPQPQNYQNRFQHNPNQPRNFISEELHNIDDSDCTIDESDNFLETPASEPNQTLSNC